jgi:hypothetical protein
MWCLMSSAVCRECNTTFNNLPDDELNCRLCGSELSHPGNFQHNSKQVTRPVDIKDPGGNNGHLTATNRVKQDRGTKSISPKRADNPPLAPSPFWYKGDAE